MKAENKFDLETPCLIIDKNILDKNLHKMKSLADGKGKKLRPHAKTHKCTTLAKKQIDYGAIGICAAKISEAEMLTKAGVKEILLTSPFALAGKIKKFWNNADGCSAMPVITDKPGYTEDLYSGGKNGTSVTLYSVKDPGHQWFSLARQSISLKSYGPFSALIRDKKWKNI